MFRNGATVKRLIADHGQAITIEAFREAVSSFKPHVVFVCHGESSTGVCQPLTGLGAICAEHNALLLVDTVASLGGAPFAADALGVDCVYTATQKVLNAPPGVAPISFSDRAMAKIKSRSTPIHSFYFDALLLGNYWGCDDGPRRYHHTAPISTVYALRAALSRLAEEGVDECVQRHAQNAQLFYKELHDIGLELFVDNPEYRLPCLTTVKVPAGVDWKAVVDKLMSQRIEISGGLGPTVGKIWRIGTFGVNSSPETIGRVVKALKEALHP
jgi:alanine-glyoxylate transaminase/serine-glyoxylate transaminase/serine-pyruvate transaminase